MYVVGICEHLVALIMRPTSASSNELSPQAGRRTLSLISADLSIAAGIKVTAFYILPIYRPCFLGSLGQTKSNKLFDIL